MLAMRRDDNDDYDEREEIVFNPTLSRGEG